MKTKISKPKIVKFKRLKRTYSYEDLVGKRTTKLKLSSAKFDLGTTKTTARVIKNGKVLAEIVICSDGLLITQNKSTIIKWV